MPIPEPAHLRATFDANPELRAAWRDASAYRESFATPDAARQATALLADVNHMDALFFSRRPEDHASLARAIANLDPAAFASLAEAMQSHRGRFNVAQASVRGEAVSPDSAHTNQLQIPRSLGTTTRCVTPMLTPTRPQSRTAASADALDSVIPSEASTLSSPDRYSRSARTRSRGISLRPITPNKIKTAGRMPFVRSGQADAQTRREHAQSTANESQLAFLHSANAAAVEGVVAAIEAQVERLLPEGVAKNARTRVVGEIYRELDSSLRSNPQFAAQLRDAFRSGSLDDGHQRAIVSLLTGRARQALPGVAKRVLSEWTSTIVSAANERRTRQRTAERRIDIAGSSGAGNDGRRSMSPRDLDYARLTDADILNL